MASETITRNDLTAILNEVLPPTPSEYRKLLWVNPSPSSTFGAQTVSLDLSNYDAVCVEFKAYPDHWILLTVTADLNFSGMCAMGRNDTFYTQNRVFAVTSSGIAFEDCKLGTGASVYNNHNVPYKIYGIKYERVQPPVLNAEIEVLTTGATLYRIGRIRMLVMNDFAYGTTIPTLASADRPSYRAVGVGTRHNGGAYITMARMEVNTNGNVAFYNVGYYNTTSGYTGTVSGDIFNITAIWYVAE